MEAKDKSAEGGKEKEKAQDGLKAQDLKHVTFTHPGPQQMSREFRTAFFTAITALSLRPDHFPKQSKPVCRQMSTRPVISSRMHSTLVPHPYLVATLSITSSVFGATSQPSGGIKYASDPFGSW